MEKTHKQKDHFNSALIVILLAIAVPLFAFMNEGRDYAGLATSPVTVEFQAFQEYNDVNSLRTLAPGTYYIDNDGTVFWLDDESRPAVAKVNYADESQKNRAIYIDNEGNIGYLIE